MMEHAAAILLCLSCLVNIVLVGGWLWFMLSLAKGFRNI